MRFYQEWKGIIWEFNSVGEFLLHIVCRIIGGIIGFGILYLIILPFSILALDSININNVWYGSK